MKPHNIFKDKPEKKEPLGIPRSRRDNVKVGLREAGCEPCGLDASHSTHVKKSKSVGAYIKLPPNTVGMQIKALVMSRDQVYYAFAEKGRHQASQTIPHNVFCPSEPAKNILRVRNK
jgi:hypothetical protein